MSYKFTSVFADLINEFLDYRQNSGVKNIGYDHLYLKKLDKFFNEECITTISFTKETAEKWKAKQSLESASAHYKRINETKHFFEYLFIRGYPVYQLRDIKSPKSKFSPHIYTEDEIARYFAVVDSYESYTNKKYRIQLPVLFRILYCCGTRITETLLIRKKDVDLKNGIIKLSETKNAKERYIVMNAGLRALINEYANKLFYILDDEDYIFTNKNGCRLSYDVIGELHIKFLKEAGIPYLGGGFGPRIHDWRHTFAVNSFKKMIDSGVDLYVSLPIISVYLGHQSIEATERYLRLTTSMYPYLEDKFKVTLDELFEEQLYEEDK